MSRTTNGNAAPQDAGKQIEHRPQNGEETVTSLPSAHIVHSAVFLGELQGRLHGFETGIVALEGEKAGQVESFDAAIAELTAKHDASMADLDRRLADMKRGRDIAQVALDHGEATMADTPLRSEP